MKELVVISGKGGTGKTSIVASFAALAKDPVLADCDVDAADLHLVLAPDVQRREDFSGGKRAHVDSARCIACGKCQEVCRFNAISLGELGNPWIDRAFRIDPIACEGCGVCAWFCPEKAIAFEPAVNGEWYVSETRHGPMVHAKLGIAEENSGKLVSLVRYEARKLAKERARDVIIIDGSPGIGCPVIASITGAHLVLVVTEPTVSGLHDLNRVADLINHFAVPGLVCINKWDLNPEMTAAIEAEALSRRLAIAGRVRYDHGVTEAQIQRQSIVEYQEDGGAQDIRAVWNAVQNRIGNSPDGPADTRTSP
ncbi:MAG TPA: ATP-binding protein [Candidatus Hydrogenedentes bacterium]|nr:ATP-binding protein [Candidatus Hydrogenedentota bacterium]HPG68852.1 ATP-binding protein [Candidatus Hydrogenedentota bacterium]